MNSKVICYRLLYVTFIIDSMNTTNKKQLQTICLKHNDLKYTGKNK